MKLVSTKGRARVYGLLATAAFEKVEELAKEKGVSVSYIITVAINHGLKQALEDVRSRVELVGDIE